MGRRGFFLSSQFETFRQNKKLKKIILWRFILFFSQSYNEYIRHKVYDFSEEGVDSNTGDPVVYPFNECPIPHIVDIPGSYYTRNIEVIKLRLMAGGIRLAQALNDIAAS